MFLKPLVTSPKIEIGEYTYYNDAENATDFETRNVLHTAGPERLIIGRFCAIATGARFLMSAANHPMLGSTAFPFFIFGGDWLERTADLLPTIPSRGDTTIGNDVWIGRDAMIMPGVTVGDGAIIGAGAVVASDVPPYGIVVGNPARLLRRRFSDEDITRRHYIRKEEERGAGRTRREAHAQQIGGHDPVGGERQAGPGRSVAHRQIRSRGWR